MLPVDFFIFLQIIIFLFITPGLPRVVIVSHTLNYGLNRSVWTAFGDISANICQGILVVFVIGSLLKDNPQALNLMKWAGILYIVYLAYDTYTAKLNSIKSKSKNLKSRFSFYRDGFLVAGLSPKAIIFFGTIFSSFIDFSGNYLAQFIILMTTYVILDFATLMIYGFAAQKVSVWLKSNPKTLNTISACVLLIIALYVGISQNY
ncbi:LysE family translocator [Pelagibacteraceae bacterium]|jgi:homoserine/homoserine lactone efflux protein|nr:LysE family translocator [Pelagibacteraceae bacterium]MDC3233104.1 LysE family translocator [Pelagibacteraceae bacterium]|tara:strand:- start:242 stop:856 length:615 start_codon:yes stop_codon:yes gene_type:complete